MNCGPPRTDATERIFAISERRGYPPTLEEMNEALHVFAEDEGFRHKSHALAALQFRRALSGETDRGVALFSAAFLESRLDELLRRYFVQRDKVADSLLEGTGGLSTFSSRTDLVMLLGLIPESAWRDLHLVRKIRNDFAHSPESIDFSQERIAARCRELVSASMAERPRARYTQAVMGLAGWVDSAIQRIEDGDLASCGEANEIGPNASTVRGHYESFVERLAELLERSANPQ